MLSVGKPAGVGVQVQDAMAELLVLAMYLLDHLLRTADQCRTPGDEITEVGEDWLQAEPYLELALRIEDRPVHREGILRVAGGVVAGRTGTDHRAGGVIAVVHPPFAVVAHQLSIGLDRVGDIGGEERVAVARRQVDGLPAGGTAVPDPDRPLERTRSYLGLAQDGPEPRGRGHGRLAPDLPEQRITLRVAVPLVLRRDVEQLALRGAVTLPMMSSSRPPDRWSSVA